MMLIPFIENAFKHGINPEEESGIVVRINIDHDVLRLNVRNRLVRVLREDERGLGMANTRSRLELQTTPPVPPNDTVQPLTMTEQAARYGY